MITTNKIFPYQQKLFCDECGVEMEYAGVCLASAPPQYIHQCPNCGAKQNPPNVFPQIIWKSEENINEV